MRSTVFLARMFTRAKWKQCVDLGSQEIPADAVTCDLKTRDNTLSFWQCGEGTDEEVSEACAGSFLHLRARNPQSCVLGWPVAG